MTLKTNNKQDFKKSFIIGGISGCVGKTVIAPLERVKYIFMVDLIDFRLDFYF
jgi:hypothetical protein